MNQSYDLCIIGAGASGLAAANIIDPRISICIIDKNEIPGRKILATGGGKCNLTNEACDRCHMTLDFFHGLGLETTRDKEGRYYPYSRVAADVVRALTSKLADKRIDWSMNSRVNKIEKTDRFIVRYTDEEGSEEKIIEADNLLLCCGGKAAPAFGTTGDGYRLARDLGHTSTRTYPILTGISCHIPPEVAGVRARCQVSLLEDGIAKATERGEIQFTAEGLSGICIFNLTPLIKARDNESPGDAMRRFTIKLDLAPDFSEEEVINRDGSFGIVTESLAEWIPPEKLKSTILPVESVWGWDRAQCTAGGVSMDEVCDETMESKVCSGLFFAGEILDVSGPCGGFNLNHAWETGILAATAINRRVGH